MAMEKEGLIARRNNNTLITSKKLSAPLKKLKKFLLKNEGYKYHLLLWNCRWFSDALWGAIDKSQSYTKSYPEFLLKIENASRITHIEKYSSPTISGAIEHHELIIQIDNLIWGLLSFESNGIETGISIDKNEMIARRPNNRLIKGKHANVSAERLRDFLKRLNDED